MKNLQTIAAKVLYQPSPWPDPHIERGWVFSGWGTISDGKVGRMLFPVKPPDPPKWTEIHKVYFALEDGDERKVLDFYRGYGTILGGDPEPLDEVKKRLDQFRRLTVVVECLKKPNEDRSLERIRHTLALGKPVDLESEDAVGSFSPGEIQGPFAAFLLPSPASHAVWHVARDKAGIWNEAWERVSWASAQFLRDIPLVPLVSSSPPVMWGFHASGALQAAFLQWFFQNLAYVNVKTCEAPGCNNLVLPPRQKYCSTRCEERMRKRRYRERLKNRKS